MLVLSLAVCITLADQVTKFLVIKSFELGDSITILPGLFDLRYVRNTGAAWGMFGGFNNWLILFSLVVLICLIVFRRYLLQNHVAHKITMALMLAGIAGNLLDRLRYGYVVDFLHFHWRTHSFPTFNIADSAICIGVAIYIISSYLVNARPTGDEAGTQHVDLS
jgi:signal peptidase II